LEHTAKAAEKQYHNAVRQRKNTYRKEFLADNDNIWKAAKYMKSGDNTAFGKVPQLVKADGTATTSHKEQAEELLAKFFPPLPDNIKDEGPRQQRTPVTMPNLTLEEVERQLWATKSWKAPGEDGLPAIVWKQVRPSVKHDVLAIFQASLEEGVLPDQWRHARIIPLKKWVLPWREPFQFSVSLDTGSFWTTLPNLVFALFATHWAWIACAIADRQPYVELRKRAGAKARKSILFDYRVTPVVLRWWTAFQKSHNTVRAMTLLSVMLTYITAPFAARLFTTQLVSIPKPIPIVYSTEYKDNNLNSKTNWRPVLNVVSATLLYEGKSIAWTNNQYAFRPFSNHSTIPVSADIKAQSTSFGSYVNCELIKDYNITLNQVSGYRAGNIIISGNDRGCHFAQKITVSNTQQVYLKTTSVGCSTYYSRLVFSAGTYSSSSANLLDDVSVISCVTGYRRVDGNLRISSLNASPSIQSFDETGQPVTSRPFFLSMFEQGIPQPVTFNPQSSSSTSDMGSLILSYAQKLQPSSPLSPNVLIQSIQ
jgi:hypothetical protein